MKAGLCALGLALCLAGCGPATGRGFAGAPLVALRGQLDITPGVSLSGPLRLALVWTPYPHFAGGGDLTPGAVVAQDLPYEGTFPIDYRFELFDLPPAEASADLSALGGRGRGARGFLVAYQDLNGNHTLDTIRPGAGPADRILGTSLATEPGAESFYLEYVSAVPAEWPWLARGFTLRRERPGATNAPVPLDTPIPLRLVTTPLDWLVCESLFLSGEADPARPCAHPTSLRVIGHVGSGGDLTDFVNLSITDGSLPSDYKLLTDTEVRVNDEVIPFDPSLGYHHRPLRPSRTLAAGALATVSLSHPGYPARSLEARLPGAFELLEPLEGAAVSAALPLRVRWTPAAFAGRYVVWLCDESRCQDVQGTAQTQLEASPLKVRGKVLLRVVAEASPVQLVDGSQVIASSTAAARWIDVAP